MWRLARTQAERGDHITAPADIVACHFDLSNACHFVLTTNLYNRVFF
jgi:hypothetical protein